jgi:hypothetical protein
VHFRAGVCLLALVACGRIEVTPIGVGDAAAPDAPDAAFAPTPHDPPPLLPFGGGSVLASANLVVVTFAGYPLADDVEAMADWISGSSWLAATGAQYGVGAPTVLAKVRSSQTAPSFSSTAAFAAWVAGEVGGELPPPPSPSTLYAFVLPSGESLSDPSIGTLCDAFTGYHDASARAYAFAAIGTCPNHVPGLTDVEQVERVFSHEVIEALTDPFGDGWAARDPDDPWSFIGGGEVADVCNGWVREDGFLAVRSWSNAAASAGLDPCQPVEPPSPYFGVVASSRATQHVAPGGAVTLGVTGFSTEATSDWTVDVVVDAYGFVPEVTFLHGPMNDGRTASITIGVPASAASGSTAVVQLRSHHAGDATYSLEPLAVRAE